MTSLASLTEFPNLYAKTNWSQSNSSDEQEDIIINRNWFAKTFKLKQYYADSIRVIGLSDIFVHCELYRTIENRYIYLTSSDSECELDADNLGMISTKKLYSKSTFSYYIMFHNKSMYNNFPKVIKKTLKI